MITTYFILAFLAFESLSLCLTKSIKTQLEYPYDGPPAWPLPQIQLPLPTYYSLNPNNFQILTNQLQLETCDVLKFAVDHYTSLIFLNDCKKLDPNAKQNWQTKAGKRLPENPNYKGELQNLTIKIRGKCESYPHFEMKEDYTLHINSPDFPGQALLMSESVWGVLRGFETFSQLIYNKHGQFYINHNYVQDFPRFKYRGYMVDTSRHYLSIKTIKTHLNAMLYNKLNVFHWHLVDDQSFPFVSRRFPKLSENGAYTDRLVYTPDDVKYVLEYARLRGIRVIPEFDTPGHTQAWGKGQPELLTKCYDKGEQSGSYGPIDPTVPENYVFLRQLFQEIGQSFPDQYLHLGGDEVDFTCWSSNPNITQFMREKGFGHDYAKLEQYYIQNLINIVEKLTKSYIVWQEVFDNGVDLKNDTVVHVWKGDTRPEYLREMATVTSRGYRAILSSPWYLSNFKYGADWKDFYDDDPLNFNGTDEQYSLVMGGEICVWGEYVDGTNAVSRTWPRAAPVAERLWSPSWVKDSSKAVPRLDQQRCRMLQRGVRVEPVDGPGYCECDYAV